jgi:hypothetical protein
MHTDWIVYSAQAQGSFSKCLHYTGFHFYLRMDLEMGTFLEMYGIKRNPKQVDSAQNSPPVYFSVSFERYI